MLGLGLSRMLGINNFIDKLYAKKEKHLLKKKILKNRKEVAVRKKPKIFVIGFNKTGTTSVHHALLEFDIIVGHQRHAERLMTDVFVEKYDRLYDYCLTAEAFQDVPFSKPDIFKLLDKQFPNSKFILTVRDSDKQWFNSISKFHAKLWGKDGNVPTAEELKQADYVYKGYPYDNMTFTFGNEDYYNEARYTQIYNNHNNDVLDYFKNRPDDLLVINVSEKESYIRFCNFIGETPLRDTFEWKNKTLNQ